MLFTHFMFVVGCKQLVCGLSLSKWLSEITYWHLQCNLKTRSDTRPRKSLCLILSQFYTSWAAVSFGTQLFAVNLNIQIQHPPSQTMTTSLLPRAFSSSSLTDAVFICVGATSYATAESGKTASGDGSISLLKWTSLYVWISAIDNPVMESRLRSGSWKERVNVTAACFQIMHVGCGCWCKSSVQWSQMIFLYPRNSHTAFLSHS